MRMYIKETATSVVPDRSKPVVGAVAVECSPISSMLCQDAVGVDGEEYIHYGTDIAVLLNQQRLSKELVPIAESVFNSARSAELSDDYKDLSDEDILSCIKSRYIQAPCEVQDWTKYLLSELDALVAARAASEPKEPETPPGTGGISGPVTGGLGGPAN